MESTTQIFKALAEEVRLRIIALLISGELCVCDLMEVLDLPQSTISRHLAYLRNTGWVEGRRAGTWMHYRLNVGETTLQQTILVALEKHLDSTPVIQADRVALRFHLENRSGEKCS